jgi:hypothetical protein
MLGEPHSFSSNTKDVLRIRKAYLNYTLLTTPASYSQYGPEGAKSRQSGRNSVRFTAFNIYPSL